MYAAMKSGPNFLNLYTLYWIIYLLPSEKTT